MKANRSLVATPLVITLTAIVAAGDVAVAAPAYAGDTGAAAESAAATPPSAHASPPSAFHADAEVDPTAYALGGYSLHVGVGWKRLRVDLGNFAINLPRFVAGNDDFDLSSDGYGLKVQYFPFSDHQKGGFIGVDGEVTRMNARRAGTELVDRQSQIGMGVNLGWRFSFGEHFYATPWLGVVYAFNPKDVSLDGANYHANHLILFPAVHFGYRFR